MENFLQSIVGFVDTYFVSQLGLEAVAAVGVTNAILQIYFAVFLAVGTVSTILMAEAVGAKDNTKARKIAGGTPIESKKVDFSA